MNGGLCFVFASEAVVVEDAKAEAPGGGVKQVMLERVEATVKAGEEVLAEVQSAWCCIDAETLRPARLREEVTRFFFPE